MRRLYGRWVRRDALCFDVGAHVGNRSFVWGQMGARVIALEPQPLFVAWLRRQFAAQASVTVLDVAIGRSLGMARMQVSPITPTVSSVSAEWVNQVQQTVGFERVHWTHEVAVPQLTLDRLIAQYGVPGFCKIDVEGHELAVLNGLSQPIPALSFEVIPAAKAEGLACVARLDTLGSYRYAVSIGEENRLGAWMNSAEIQQSIINLPDTSPSVDVFAEAVTFS